MLSERFSPDLGGVARSASRTAAAISMQGWQVHVVAWTKTLPPGQLETEERSDGVIVHRVGLFSNWDYSMQHTTNVLTWLHADVGFKAVWGHYLFPAGYMAVLFAKTCGLPCTVSARGNDVDRLMFPPGDFARLLWTVERADIVSSVSEDLARKIRILSPQTCVEVLANVVDTTVFQLCAAATESGLRSELGIQPGEVVLGFSGELRHKKGLPFLLAALAEVRESRACCLLVIGVIRPRERAHLATFAIECPEAVDRIIVTGHLDDPADVANHLHLCDAVLQPSVWDGLPNSILEAMACGKIVIASDAGGIPEAIHHRENGFAVPIPQLHNLGTATPCHADIVPEYSILTGRFTLPRLGSGGVLSLRKSSRSTPLRMTQIFLASTPRLTRCSAFTQLTVTIRSAASRHTCS